MWLRDLSKWQKREKPPNKKYRRYVRFCNAGIHPGDRSWLQANRSTVGMADIDMPPNSWHVLETKKSPQQKCWWLFKRSGKPDLNRRPSRWQRDALPLSYSRLGIFTSNNKIKINLCVWRPSRWSRTLSGLYLWAIPAWEYLHLTIK